MIASMFVSTPIISKLEKSDEAVSAVKVRCVYQAGTLAISLTTYPRLILY